MRPYRNEKYTMYDWRLILIGFLLVALICLGFKTCNDANLVPVSNMPIKEEINAQIAQKAYDQLLVQSAHQLDSLEMIVAESKKKSGKIIIKYRNIHDTILLTPADSQQRITKMLCPATGDSVNLQEINYCLASGKQHEELYKEAAVEINAKDKELAIQDVIIIQGQKTMSSKDTLIGTYRSVNGNLNKNLEKEKARKKVWRNISVGTGLFILIQIFLSVI